MMGAWNSYVWPMMVTTSKEMRLITTGLRMAFTSEEGRTVQGLQMAGSTIVTAPLLIVFIILRKYIMRGVSRSGIKG
jgi:multiple sugar transport system permease protein